MTEAIRVLIVDDQHLFVEAMAASFDEKRDVNVVGEAQSGELAVSAVDLRNPDVVIVDYEIRSDNAARVLSQLRGRYPDLPIIVLTDRVDPDVVRSAVRAGARGLVLKSASLGELADTVRRVTGGESSIPPALLTPVLDLLRDSLGPPGVRPPLDRLTPRELEVLERLVAGRARATIARELGVSLNTVRTHVKRILPKLQVHSTLEAVHIALQAGMRPDLPDELPPTSFE